MHTDVHKKQARYSSTLVHVASVIFVAFNRVSYFVPYTLFLKICWSKSEKYGSVFVSFVQANLPYSCNLYFRFIFAHNLFTTVCSLKPGIVILTCVTYLISEEIIVVQNYTFLKVRMGVSQCVKCLLMCALVIPDCCPIKKLLTKHQPQAYLFIPNRMFIKS